MGWGQEEQLSRMRNGVFISSDMVNKTTFLEQNLQPQVNKIPSKAKCAGTHLLIPALEAGGFPSV